MLSALHYLVENSPLYTLKDEQLGDWPEVTRGDLDKNRLHRELWEVPLSVIEALRPRCPGRPTAEVVEIDKNGLGLTREVESDTFTSVSYWYANLCESV